MPPNTTLNLCAEFEAAENDWRNPFLPLVIASFGEA
jgi:hypothetical protein